MSKSNRNLLKAGVLASVIFSAHVIADNGNGTEPPKEDSETESLGLSQNDPVICSILPLYCEYFNSTDGNGNGTEPPADTTQQEPGVDG